MNYYIFYIIIGFLIGIFFQKNIIPIIEGIFEILHILIETKKSNSIYDLNIMNKEIIELNETKTSEYVLGFRSKGDGR